MAVRHAIYFKQKNHVARRYEHHHAKLYEVVRHGRSPHAAKNKVRGRLPCAPVATWHSAMLKQFHMGEHHATNATHGAPPRIFFASKFLFA